MRRSLAAMCGIIGITGCSEAWEVLLDGLARLEYRGYDSAGVALLGGGELWRGRAACGRDSLIALRKQLAAAPPARAGVGHTRWATHGHPTEVNAHPHLDCTGQVAVVHNGIVENSPALRRELEAAGHRFGSDTDSEVIAHLVERELAALGDRPDRLPTAVRRALADVRGSYALVVVCSGRPEQLVAARHVSPLVLAAADDGAMLVASDVPALLGRAARFWTLADGQVATVVPGELAVTDLAGQPVEPTPLVISWDLEQAQKGGHPDFMSKEIAEQPAAVADTLLGRLQADGSIGLDELRMGEEALRRVDKVTVVACGSSFHAGLAAKLAIEHWARLPVEVDIASEFRYRDPVLDERTLVVGISQSGETVDTLQALRHGRRCRSHTVVVCNVVDSSMAREADGVLYTRAGPEIGVAATKTHLAQLAALEVLALHLAQVRGALDGERAGALLGELAGLPDLVADAVSRGPAVAEVAARYAGVRDVFFLGRHVGYPVALEGALKLKEISYVRAEAYPAGELKHGPIALIEPGTVVVAVATRTPLWEKLMANVAEVRSRGASVILVANDGDEETAAIADDVLWVPATEPLFTPMVDVVPLQQLAYEIARATGNDVDRPRNLAKTVTVE
jgi:glucosamine--fructose-6-phosphate aminotransferase (isomerizing)